MKTLNRKDNKFTRTARFFARLADLGLSYSEADTLRLAEKTLHRWAELECGDGNEHASWSIERDETTGKPYLVTHPHNGASRRHRIADREAGALRRIAAVLADHGTLWSYHQTDPRGCALYVGRVADLIEHGTGRQMDIVSCYNRGIAVVVG
jgi:hypothetical protein